MTTMMLLRSAEEMCHLRSPLADLSGVGMVQDMRAYPSPEKRDVAVPSFILSHFKNLQSPGDPW
jgi:hypothetical protein